MMQVGYAKSLAAGVVANAGTLGMQIPPSIVMIVHVTSRGAGIERMFPAGIVPGIVGGPLLMIVMAVPALSTWLPTRLMGPVTMPSG